jgi:hypothetical protein
MKKFTETTEPIAPELKHDTMEYSASTEGDDVMDAINEDEEITAEELDALEEDGTSEEAYALNAAETDREADADNFLTSPDDIDELEDEDEDDEEEEFRR